MPVRSLRAVRPLRYPVYRGRSAGEVGGRIIVALARPFRDLDIAEAQSRAL
jgi:hypothetical protein